MWRHPCERRAREVREKCDRGAAGGELSWAKQGSIQHTKYVHCLYRWKLHLPKDYFVTGPPPPPGEFVVSPLDPSSERGPCAPPRGPFLKICFFRYTRLHTSRVRALETASFTLEGAAATCEETAMDETMVVLLTHGARQVERALRRALHCPQQHSKLPAPHLLALVP